jgi:hypothetical protein
MIHHPTEAAPQLGERMPAVVIIPALGSNDLGWVRLLRAVSAALPSGSAHLARCLLGQKDLAGWRLPQKHALVDCAPDQEHLSPAVLTGALSSG